jgi:hypothetical protein
MNDYPEDLKNLYMEFGQAAEIAQVMEVEAGNLSLSFATLAFDPATITDDERQIVQALINDVNKRTFGNLLKQIRKIGDISEEIEKSVNDALEKRNYLIHKFFRTHNLAIHSEEGRKQMRSELREISEVMSRAHTILSGMTHTLNEIFGRPNISEDQARKLMKKGKKLGI